MKFKNKMIIISLIIALLFTVSAVSAADGEVQAISAHNSTDDVVSTVNDDDLGMMNDGEILAETDNGSFAALNKKISGASGTVTLENDYAYSSTDSGTGGVSISSAITIDGGNHIIDAKGSSRIFSVSTSNVVIKNIIFKNAYYAGNGGAIYSDTNDISIINCTFINNEATNGGALYSNAYYRLGSVVNSTFINNRASSQAATIYNYADAGTIDGCIFINNTASTSSIIYTYSAITVKNSVLINNKAENFFVAYNPSITANYNWWGATADDYQNAPVLGSGVTVNNYYVLNMTLGNQDATITLNNLYENGAITNSYNNYALPSINFTVKAKNINVDDNVILGTTGVTTITYAPADAYSLTVDYNGVELSREVKPSFKLLKDKINSEGNEITLEQDYIYDSTKDDGITKIEFAKDMVIDGQGHIIDAMKSSNIFYFNDETNSYNLTLKNIVFANATGDNGAAVYFKGKKIEIINCTFINNKANSQGDAVYVANANSDSNKITQSIFKDNIGTNSVLYINLDSLDACLELTNSILMGNDATYNVKGTSNVIVDYNWWGNTAENYNDAIIARADGVTLNNWLVLNITANTDTNVATVSLNNLYDRNVVRVYENYALPSVNANINGINVTVQKSTLTLDSAGKANTPLKLLEPDAVLTAGYGDVETSFEIHYVIVYDGSFKELNDIIRFSSENDVIELTKDYVYSDTDTITSGIAITKTITVNGNDHIIDAKGNCGIFLINSPNVAFNDITFKNGIFDTGGAIYCTQNANYLTVDNCTFINNTATNTDGGAIWSGSYYFGSVTNSKFINNTAVEDGAAIFTYSYYTDAAIDGCTFIHNTAPLSSVIYAWACIIRNSVFLDNPGNMIQGKYDSYKQINYNWFGNTVENYNTQPSITSSIIGWLYLDIKFYEDFAIVSLNNLYTKSSGSSSVYANYNLPEITLNINSTTLNLNTDKITLDSTGKAIVPYTKIADDAKLTVSNDYMSLTKDCVVGEFDVLQELIDTTVGDTIELNRNYTFIEGVDTLVNGISITRDITIDGKGHTIDGSNLARIFYITTNGVTLKNINFVNGYASQGGAIYNNGGSGFKLVNCTFEKNVAYDNPGGAIYTNSNGVNDYINCTFIGNKITTSFQFYGGAIYIYEYSGQNNFIGCTFINNTATGYGGAIATANGKAITNIDRSVFVTNSAAAYPSIYITGGPSAEFYLKNSIIFSKGLTSDTATQVRVNSNLGAGDVNYNWWMHTIGEYAQNGYVRYSGGGLTVTKYLFLDMNFENEIATISLNNLYDSSTQTCSTYEGELPKITFNLSGVNVDIEDNATLNKNGVNETRFDLTAQTGSITATYDSVSITKSVVLDDSFTVLQNKINRVPEGSELILYHDYNYDGTKDTGLTDGIVIDKELTIDGQGFTIDAKDVARIFKIDDNTKNIVFKNIKFTNAHSDDGAAVYANCNNIEIINCTFEANEATNNGDALYVIANGCDITESTFINNLGTQSALYLASDLQDAPFNIDNSLLVNNAGINIVKDDKIALTANNNWWGNTVDVTADLSGGLAQNWYLLDMSVDNAKSIATVSLNNLWDGSAYMPCDNYALPTITANIQTNTYTSARKDKVIVDKEGDTVGYIVTDETNAGEITVNYNGVSITREVSYDEDADYSFKALKKLIDAAQDNDTIELQHDYEYVIGYDDITAGIDIIQDNLTINGKGYTINAKGQTRIFNVGDSSSNSASYVTIKNTTFINGKISNNGGAIRWYGDKGNLTNCTFRNNTAATNYGGGALYWDSSFSNITNCTFEKNSAGTNSGGAIYIQADNVDIFNLTFQENKASKGGSLYIYSNNVTIVKSTFAKNSPGSSGGAIYVALGTVYITAGNNITIINSTFSNNTVTSQGGAIYIAEGNGGENIAIINSSFSNNHADDSGGAIYWADGKNRQIINSTFKNNSANKGGGAIYWSKIHIDSGKIFNSTFIRNYVITTANSDIYGGAININSGSLTINKTDFIDNYLNGKSNAKGGAISYSSSDNLDIIDSNFIGNGANSGVGTTATNKYAYGGAIYFSGGNINITRSNFNRNYVDSPSYTYGCIIDWENGNGEISNSSFINNHGKTSNNGIFGRGSSKANITNCIFLNNTYGNNNYLKHASITAGTFNFTYCWFGNTPNDNTGDQGIAENNYLFVYNRLTLNVKHDEYMVVGEDRNIKFVYTYSVQYTENGNINNRDELYDASKLPKINLTLSTVNGELNKYTALIGENLLFKGNEIGSASITGRVYDSSVTRSFNVKCPTKIIVNETFNSFVGDFIPFDASVVCSDGSDLPSGVNYTWKYDYNGSNEEFAIYNNGFYGWKSGTYLVKITANLNSTSDYSNSITTVTIIVSQIDKEIIVGGPSEITYGNENIDMEVSLDITDETYRNKLTYDSQDPNIVTVTNDGLMTAVNAGKTNITITYEGSDKYKANSKKVEITVQQAGSDVTVPDSVFVYGSDVVITVTTVNSTGDVSAVVLDEEGNVVSGAVVTTAGNDITVTGLNVGNYTLNVTTNDIYNNHYPVTRSGTLNITKAGSDVTVPASSSVTYGSSVDVTVSIPDGGNASDVTAKLYLGDVEVPGVISVDGLKITVDASDLDVDTYTLKVTTVTDSNHDSVTNDGSVVVGKAGSDVSVPASTVVYDSRVIVVASDLVNASGVTDAALYDGDNKVKDLVVNDGVNVVVDASGVDVGTYTLKITTIPIDSNHESVTKEVGVDVNPAGSDVSVPVSSSVVYGSSVDVTVSIPDGGNASGVTAKLYNGDVEVAGVVSVDGLKITVDAATLNVGTYALNVTTVTDANHVSVTKEVSVVVSPAGSDVSVPVSSSVVYDGNVTVVASDLVNASGVTDAALYDGDNKIKDLTVNDGVKVVVDATGVDVGTYTLKVTTVPVDGNHESTTKEGSVVVNQAGSDVSVPVSSSVVYGSSVVVDVVIPDGGNASGVTAKLYNGDVEVAGVVSVDGLKITVNAATLNVGTYTLNVTTVTDANHVSVTKEVSVVVSPAGSDVIVPVSSSVVYGSSVTVVASDLVNASGVTAALYDGDVKVKDLTVNDGVNVVVDATGVDVGTYTLKVTTVTDANHESTIKEVSVVVSPAGSDVIVPVSSSVVYGSSVDVTVTIPDGGNASSVTAKLYLGDSEIQDVVTVEGLKITVNAATLNVGTYTLNVTTVTDANHASVTKEVSVTVDPAGSDVTVPVSSSVVYDDSVTVVASDLVNASGVTDAALYDGDNKIKDLTVNDGVKVVVDATGVDVGNYTLKVTTVPVDGNHESTTKEGSVVVNQAGSDVSVPVSSSVVYGSSVVVDVVIPDGGNASGVTAKLYNGDVEVAGVVSVDGLKITVNASDLDIGTYTLNVTTVTDANHASVTKEVRVTVTQAGSDVTVPDSANVNYTDSVDVVVSGLVNASGVTAKLYLGSNEITNIVSVNDLTITVNASALDVGDYTLKVGTIPIDDNHESVIRECTITVNKIDSLVYFLPNEIHFAYEDEGSTVATCTGCTIDEVNVTVRNHPEAVIKMEGDKITVSGLAEGEYTMQIITTPDKNHNSVEKTVNVTVSGISAKMSMQVTNITVGENEIVFITMDTEAKGIVNITILKGTEIIDSKNITINNRYNKTVFNGLKVGKYEITAHYYGSQNYNDVIIPDIFFVHPIYNFEFEAFVNDTICGNRTNATVTLSADASGSIQIGDAVQTIENPVTVIELPIQNVAGKNNVTVKYIPDANSKYGAQEITVYYNVAKKSTEITIGDISGVKVGDDVEIIASAYEGANITLYVDGIKLDSKIIEGVTAGSHTIIASVAETDQYLSASANKTFTVAKHDVDVSVGGTPTKIGEKSTITVNANVTEGIVIVNVNGTEYSVDLAQNNTIEVAMPNVGSVPLTARYVENHKYNAKDADASTIEVANKTASGIVIEIPNEIKVGEEIVINVTTPNNATLTVTINDISQTVSDGKIAFTPTAAGIYSVEARTAETADYFGGVVFKSFEATKNAAEIKVEEIAPKKVGDDVLINVTTNSDGIITVLVDREVQVLDENNTATIRATAGTHEIIVSVNETGKYLQATKTVTYEVAKHDVIISVSATSTKVGEKSTITVDVNVTEGIVAVNINGAEYSLNLSENNSFEIVMPEVGSVPLTARYIENDMYNAANAEATTIEVTNKSSSNIVIEVPDDLKVGEEITINVTTPNNETLTVTINDETQTVSDGKITFTPTVAGIYSVEARTAETTDYFGGVVFKSFEATKNAAEIKVEEIAPKKVGDDVLINVTTNSDGIITVLVDREVQVLDENNTATIRATAGTHEIIVSVNETGKYLSATKTVTYEVAKYDVSISVSATQTKVGEKSTITVDVNVTEGIVAVNINGAEYSLNLSENNSFEIVMPEVGSVPLTARYIENDMYNAANAEATTIEVTNKSSSNIVIEVPDDIKVGEEITINVTTPNNETLTVTINDIPQTVTDGKITFTPAEAGVYNIVAHTNETADIFGEVSFASFEVTKKATEITISDITGKKVGDDVEINATSYDGALIVIYVDGVKLDSNVLENVSAGKHTIVASVAETGEYLSASANMTFTVSKHDVSISVSGNETTTVGEKLTVTVDANVTEGSVIVNVNGTEYSLDLAKNNTFEVLMTQVGFGTITARYVENDKYNTKNSTAKRIMVISKNPSNINIGVPDDIKVGSEITISVTADNSESLTVTINDVKQTISDGKIKFTPAEAGSYIIRASTNETILYFGEVKFTTFEAVKNPAEVTIAEIAPKMVDDDVVVEVSSYDGADIVVYIDGVKQALTDGKVTVRATAGTHTITASVAETGEYLSASANRTFTVSKYDVEINVSATPVNVGEKSTVTVNTNASEGIVLININGTEYSLNLTNANTLEVVMNAPGTASLTAKYVENYKYNAKDADPASIEVTQKEQSSIIIEVSDVCIVGEEITVNVATNGDNLTVNVIFNGETVKTANASFAFTPQRDGVYTVIAKTTENDTVYGGENATSFAALNRTKEAASITVSPISDAKVGDEITFTVTAIGGGDAIVKINGKTVNATDGVYRYTPEKGGLSILTVETPENERYSKGFDVTTFNVDKKESSINITFDGIIEVGKDVEVSIVSYDGADIAVYVDGMQKTLADGKITVKATAGSHIILASVAENDQYLASSANRTFTVDKKEANVTIAVEGILEVEKNIRLNIQSYEGADIVVYMDGIALDDWDVPFKATAGDHLVLARVAENDEYLSASANVTFTISKKPSSVYVSGSTVYVGEKSLIEVEITKGATGIVIVNVNGTEYSLNVSQNRSLGVVLDKAGLYNISARYLGDGRFLSSESEINTIFAMDKKDSKIEIEAVDEAYAGDDVVVKVTSTSDAALEVYLDGVKQSLEEGRFTISNITAANHMIEVTSPETSEYKYNSTRKFINALKMQSEISIEMPEAANVGDVIEINVTSYDGADITVYIDGVKQTLADGKITVNATAGTHTVIASVAENDKYMASALNRTFAVSKLTSEIAVSATNVTIGQTTLITIETNMSEGIVVVKINGTELAVDLAKSKTASIVLDAPGDYELSAAYQENDKYMESYALPSTVKVSEKQSSTVDVEIPEIQAGENETITVSVPNATGEVHIIIDGNDNIVPLDENGTASYTVPEMGAGDHSIVVVYHGDETHESKVVSKTLAVEKQASQANVTAPGEVSPGENATVTVEIPGATGNVSVIVDGKEHIIPLDENGTANYTIADVGSGDHSVVVIYPGDDTHKATHASSSFNVPAEPVVIKLATEFTEIVVNANVITAVLKDIDGNAVANATVSYEIGGDVANTTTDANGSFIVYGVANSKVTISYAGNDSLLATNTSLVLENVVEPKLGSEFNVTEGISIKTYAVDTKAGEIGKTVSFRLTDSNGNPIVNATIKFAYKTVILTRTTNSKGIVFLGINTQVAQEALCAMSYVGDEKYNATFVAFSFDIQYKPITISASSKTYKSTVKTKKYTVTLKTEKCNSRDGKVYLSSGKKVTIKINGKTYTAKTNSKGQATFKITDLTQKGRYIALIKFDGDKTYESASKKVKITIK